MGVTSRTGIIFVIHKKVIKRHCKLNAHTILFLKIDCEKTLDKIISENQSAATEK